MSGKKIIEFPGPKIEPHHLHSLPAGSNNAETRSQASQPKPPETESSVRQDVRKARLKMLRAFALMNELLEEIAGEQAAPLSEDDALGLFATFHEMKLLVLQAGWEFVKDMLGKFYEARAEIERREADAGRQIGHDASDILEHFVLPHATDPAKLQKAVQALSTYLTLKSDGVPSWEGMRDAVTAACA